MRIIKFTAAVMLCLIFLVYTGETAYYNLADKTSQSYDFVYFNKVYESQELVDDVYRLLKKYNCSGFFITYDTGDSSTDTYCCTDNDTEHIQDKLGFKECSFRTIVSGSIELKFREIRSTDFSEKILDGFYIDGSSEQVYSVYNELNEKYSCELRTKSDYANTYLTAAVIFAVLVFLLSLYDALNKKRDVCISLTLGNSLVKTVLKKMLSDSVIIISAALVVFAVMNKITAAVLVRDEYILLVSAFCFANIAGLSALFKADICSVLKHGNRSSALLPVNYLLKMLSGAALIAVVCFSVSLKDSIRKYRETENFRKYFGDYTQIELSESAEWASRIDSLNSAEGLSDNSLSIIELIDEELDDYVRYFRLLENESDVFLLNAFRYFDLQVKPEDVTSLNAVLSSDSAGEYIENQTGIKLSRDRISLLVPEKYDETALYLCKSWLKDEICSDIDSEVEIINYTEADIAAFNYEDYTMLINNEYDFTILSSPVVIYFPDAEKYSYFGEQTLQTNISENRVHEILKENNIASTRVDSCRLTAKADRYENQSLASAIIVLLSFGCTFGYWIIITISTIFLDIHLYRKERAIKKILGKTFAERFIAACLIMAAVTVLSAVLGNTLLEYVNLQNTFVIAVTAVVLAASEIVILLVAGAADERKNITKTLKGGAL